MSKKRIIQKVFQEFKQTIQEIQTERSIVDSTEVESFKFRMGVAYSGKSHKHASKITVEINDAYIPLTVIFARGSSAESKELDKLLARQDKLPYELYLDMGYEKYERRRNLKKQGCQVHMEQKIKKNSKKKGPRFSFSDNHKDVRKKIETFFPWIQSFWRVRFRREKTEALFHALV